MLHDLILEGHGARLVPLADEHAEPLSAFVDDRLWAGMSSPTPDTPAAMRARDPRGARDARPAARSPCSTRRPGQVRGSTSFYDWDPRIGRVEIGHTYYDPRWWGTTTNPACKLLLLTHAFETWGCARVALRADAAQHPLDRGDPTPRRGAGGRPAQPPRWPRRHARRQRVLLDPGRRVARGPRRAGGPARAGRPRLTTGQRGRCRPGIAESAARGRSAQRGDRPGQVRLAGAGVPAGEREARRVGAARSAR